ncbi:bifunctional diguanylate cyclase/phosphodiesterase [Algibacillus agarilyticus]|uniref:bifunctional diguanylate cyclase/phosphodiesterase n=1 Tax=Algibacillus agarilyticus TaxID=2234133 RepID=UPI000DD006AF|nr:EAL domain-containing protein [Algibacillus agarilyticus]
MDKIPGWTLTKWLNTLSSKITILIILSCFISGLIGAFVFSTVERNSSHNRMQSKLNKIALSSSDYLSDHFDSMRELGIVANQLLTADLAKPIVKAHSIAKQSDGSYRSDNQKSAAFLSNTQPYTLANQQLFSATNNAFDEIATLMQTNFLNFYFISKNDFIRISPGQWALEIEANHQFSQDLFFSVATPSNNPERKPIWTPIYYDDIWQSWMTSLIIPVYVNDEFVGVTGSDYVLSKLPKVLNQWVDNQSQQFAFLFDGVGNIITHPDYDEQLANTQASMNKQLNSQELLSVDLKKMLKNQSSSQDHTLMRYVDENGEAYWVAIKQIPQLNWFVAVAESSDVTELYVRKFQLVMLSGVIIFGLILSSLLYFMLKHVFLSRLEHLAQLTSEYQGGELDIGIEKEKKDEVSTVAIAMQKVTQQNQKLILGLEEEIIEKSKAQHSAILLTNAVEYSETAIAIIDEHFSIVYANPKFLQLTGHESDVVGNKIHKIFDEQMVWVLDTAYEQLVAGLPWKGDLLLNSQNDQPVWVSQTFSPMDEQIKDKKYYVSASHDISFIKKSQQQMEKLAYHDSLTGLYNRAYFKNQLSKSLEMTKRGHYSFALFYFDLDQFKRINDTLGHDAGDELLINISNKITNRLRTEDTIARLGGDEFAVILSGIASPDKAALLANQLQSEIKQPVKLSGAEVIVSASIGITMVPQDTNDMESLLRNADLAMYKAKDAGRSTYYFFDPALGQAAQKSIVIESQLRDAIKYKQFELHYQPQIDLATKTIFGFEALVRWRHPQDGLVAPNLFIPIAEQSGLIVEIGAWVLEESCRFIKRINTKFDTNYTIAVNLSARQFKDDNITHVIKKAMVNARIKPEILDIEVTETMLMGSIDDAINHMKDIKALGVQMSIDDFGTGYSSLSYLKRFPVNTLKVDRAFVKDIPHDTDDMAISAAIIAMAHKLKLHVIAEGVETQEHIDFLVENECEIGQGFLFSKPLTEAALIDYITHFKLT